MRGTLALIGLSTLATLGGCKGGKDDLGDVEPVVFLDSTRPAAMIADLPPATVDAHDATVGLWGVVGLLASDPNVLDLMEIHGGQARGGEPEPPCWQSSLISINASVDYSACTSEGITGEATVSDTAFGPLVFRVNEAFQFAQRTYTGNVGFTPLPTTAYAWSVAPAVNGGQPSPDPLVVQLGSRSADVVFTGHAAVNFSAGTLNVWGSAEVTGDNGTATATWGSDDPLVASEPLQPATAARLSRYPTCACPTGGALSYATELTVTSVTLDLSRAIDGSATTWPEIPVDTSVALPGRVVLEPAAECGEWVGSFVPDEGAVVTVDGADLRAGVERACAANSFGDEASCESVRLGAASVDGLELELGPQILNAMVAELADRQLDNGFCRL